MTFIEKAIVISIAMVCAVNLNGCTKPQKTEEVLQEQGYTQVKTTGYRIFGCPQDDFFHTGFEATNANGKNVSGVVCSGFIMGSVIRLD